MEAVFPIAAIGLLLVGVVWGSHALRRGHRPGWGALGALLSGLVVVAIWRADDLPWVWTLPKAPLAVWALAIALSILGLSAARSTDGPGRGVSVVLGWLSLLLNAAAALAFLWIATVSAGGV